MVEINSKKIGRNEPCICGSGKKYKACCGKEAVADHSAGLALSTIQQSAQQAVADGRFADAELWYRQWVSQKPTDAYALAGLGQTLCWLFRRKEGVAYLLKAGRFLERQVLKTRDPRFAVELSAQLLHWREAEAAERLARLAVKLAPDSAVPLNNLALCLTRVNLHKDAFSISQRVCHLLPDHAGCQILLALIEVKLGNAQQALIRLEQVIERNTEPDQTARGYLERGVILDSLGRYDEAFISLSRAAESHSALLTQHPAQREELFEILEANKIGFDRALLNRWPRERLITDNLPVPAFLMGFLRSGTTLTERILDAHPHIVATDESSVLSEVVAELHNLAGHRDNPAEAVRVLSELQVQQLRQFYWRRMQQEHGEQVLRKQLVDKNALNTIDVGVISVLFPEAKILFALRDPRDVCVSCFMQAFAPSRATVNLLSWEGVARQYAAVMEYWLGVRKHIQPAVLELKYEYTVTDFEATYRRVFAFLGVEWVPEVAKFHEGATGRFISTPSFSDVSQPIYNRSVERWHRYEKQFTPIQSVLEPYIKAFGYLS